MAFNFSSFDVKLNSTSNDALYMDVGRHLIVSIRKNVIRAPRGNWLKNKSRNGNGGSCPLTSEVTRRAKSKLRAQTNPKCKTFEKLVT